VQNECLSIKSRIEALDGDRQPLVNERRFAGIIIIIIIIPFINIVGQGSHSLGPGHQKNFSRTLSYASNV